MENSFAGTVLAPPHAAEDHLARRRKTGDIPSAPMAVDGPFVKHHIGLCLRSE